MNILFLNNFYYLRGGSEKVLFEEMRLLREAGHRVAIYARGHELNEPAEFAEFFPPPMDTERVSLNLKAVQSVRELIYSNAARSGLKAVIERFVPDIAHAHNIYGRLSLSVLDELKSAGVPVVMTLHDLKLVCPSYLMLNDGKVCELCRGKKFYHAALTRCHKGSFPASFVYALESWINHALGKYNAVSRFITPSRFLRDKCVEYGLNTGQITLIPNFIEAQSIPCSNTMGDYFLFLGRLSKEKGVKTLLNAYKGLSAKIALTIVGDGPERPMLEKMAADQALNVRFTGYLSGMALQEALSNARAVIMPSECYENAPLSLLEAFAYAKPVIGARIGGIPEMVDEGVNGYLFEAGNVAALAETLAKFLALSGAEITSMGQAARAKIEREYTAERHVAMLLDLYRTHVSPQHSPDSP